MEMLWSILAAVFFILWVTKKTGGRSDETIDLNSKSYAQGYWDGVRAQKNSAAEPVPVLQGDGFEQPRIRPVVVQTVVSSPQLPVVDERELRAKRDLQNINTTLYIASFLLVAAAVLFIGASLPESVRFMGVWLITVAFYVVGLVLYGSVEKLRPAAVAFVGTGLALLPFTGIAMYNFMLNDAAVCWMITSVIGLVAYVYAAAKLRNQVISYLSIAFGASLAASGVAVLHVGLMWYFVVLIVFGSVMTILARIQPTVNWLPACFAAPVQQSNKWIVPLVLISSMCAVNNMTVTDYWVISAVSALYYAAVAMSSAEDRASSLFLARFLASLSVILIAYDMTESWTTTGVTLTVVGALQVLLSMLFSPKRVASDSNNETWLWLGQAMMIMSTFFVWQDTSWDSIVSGQLAALLLVSIGLSAYLRRVAFSGFGTIAMVALPIVIGRYVITPPIDTQWLAAIFVAISAVALMIRAAINQIGRHPVLHMFLIANFGIFLMEALFHTVNIEVAWKFGIWLVVSALLYILVYLERQPWFVVLANVAFLVSCFWLAELLDIDIVWRSVVVSWMAFVFYYFTYWLAVALEKRAYGVFFWWSAIIVAGVFNIFNLASTEKHLVIAAGLGLIVASSIFATDGWIKRRFWYITVAACTATLGLQRMVWLVIPDIDILFYTHWWAAVFAGLSTLYYFADKKQESKALSVVSLSFVTFFSGLAALGSFGVSTVPYDLIFLLEHVLILVMGLVLSKKMFTTWGAVGVVLAVLKLIGFSYVLLALIAFGLITAAIYALVKQSKSLA